MNNQNMKPGEHRTLDGVLKDDDRYFVVPAGPGSPRIKRALREDPKGEPDNEAANTVMSNMFMSLLGGALGLPHVLEMAVHVGQEGMKIGQESAQSSSHVAVINTDPSKALRPNMAFRNSSVEEAQDRLAMRISGAEDFSWGKKLAEQRELKMKANQAPTRVSRDLSAGPARPGSRPRGF